MWQLVIIIYSWISGYKRLLNCFFDSFVKESSYTSNIQEREFCQKFDFKNGNLKQWCPWYQNILGYKCWKTIFPGRSGQWQGNPGYRKGGCKSSKGNHQIYRTSFHSLDWGKLRFSLILDICLTRYIQQACCITFSIIKNLF